MPFSFRWDWKRLVCLIAFGCSLAFPFSASAGPIQWRYKSTITADNGAAAVDLGTVDIVGYDYDSRTVTHTPGRGYYSAVPQVYESGQFAPEEGSQNVAVGGIYETGYYINPSPSLTLDPHFRLKLEITDVASQEQKILEFLGNVGSFGVYYTADAYDAVGGRNSVNWGFEPYPHPQTFDLGKSRYTFWGFSSSREEGTIFADIEVSKLVPTPEPSTLVLTGLGLSAFAFRKRRQAE